MFSMRQEDRADVKSRSQCVRAAVWLPAVAGDRARRLEDSQISGDDLKKNSHLIEMQPMLMHVRAERDLVYTPPALARDMVDFFQPAGTCLDPCSGSGAFLDLLPTGSKWCEVERGRDFYAWTKSVDWIISNPPFSHLLAWIRHSFKVADDIVYLMPSHRVFASAAFLDDVFIWGGIVHIRRYGSGSQWGFPFGHALAAVHYRKGYEGETSWSRFGRQRKSI